MLKQVMRPLFLGALCVGTIACGGTPMDEVAPETEDLGQVEQNACSVGTYQGACRDYGSGGWLDGSCPAATPYKWSFWNCSQYMAGSGPSAQYYRQYCYDLQLYTCHSDIRTPPAGSPPPVGPPPPCKQNC
ncbi:hypothetical protein SAMN05443572_110235 [Myxococcus fulvus]|uniref:Lipoprotein n=1 Tax=Myxococcus fulvus TaxID=33 RepID=A0A511T7N5_MYXFU|nr:hypothetical protein [Myxococcus fulvus]GEN10169.1 hypothetical protein MFU01_52060 [Myxococcus fulvus]SEU35270.1 hypothetical protein SAMN05443572_110235 [Myxococcus fulvus]